MRVGCLRACTCPHKCPLFSPRSRYHLPPGHASIFIGSGLPSGVSLCGPICSSNVANVLSSEAWTRTSFVRFSVRLSIVCIVAVMISPSTEIPIRRAARILLPFRPLLDATQLVLPELFEFTRPLVQRLDRLCVRAIEHLATVPAYTHETNLAEYA